MMQSIYLFLVIASIMFSVEAISPLSIKGNKFFNAEGQQVFFKGIFIIIPLLIVGVAYQRSPQDPLVNTTQCQLDAALMKTLGANAIRCNPFQIN
jgi:1,3-beta-glucanosyltransferase GAS1